MTLILASIQWAETSAFYKVLLDSPKVWGWRALDGALKKLRLAQAVLSFACCQTLMMTLSVPRQGQDLLRLHGVKTNWHILCPLVCYRAVPGFLNVSL